MPPFFVYFFAMFLLIIIFILVLDLIYYEIEIISRNISGCHYII